MPRTIPIGQQSDGINLRRYKGGADPAGLFDLVNAWVTPKGTIKRRPGTVIEGTFGEFYTMTRGLFYFSGVFYTFSHTSLPAPDPDIRIYTLRHPTGGGASLEKVHRVFAFFGRLYVVAEFSDGVIEHYYLEVPEEWQANTTYDVGDFVVPTTDNGFFYEATGPAGGAALPNAWRPNVEVAIGDYVQPTVYNGFKYRLASALLGGPPTLRTSNHEPEWPTVDGATVHERRYLTEPQVTPPPAAPPEPPPRPPPGYGPFPPTRPPTHDR